MTREVNALWSRTRTGTSAQYRFGLHAARKADAGRGALRRSFFVRGKQWRFGLRCKRHRAAGPIRHAVPEGPGPDDERARRSRTGWSGARAVGLAAAAGGESLRVRALRSPAQADHGRARRALHLARCQRTRPRALRCALGVAE